MKIVAYCALLLGFSSLLASCDKNQAAIVPTIFLTGAGPSEFKLGNNEDTAIISFSFVDGDGDLGGPGTVTLIDTRDTNTYVLDFPEIMDELKNPKTGQVEGDCALVLLTSQYLIPRDDTFHQTMGDTVNFRLYIKDAAGHQSNELKVGPFYLKP